MSSVMVTSLSKAYERRGEEPLCVLKTISFHAAEREFICILGPSGCGKTTILNSLAGLVAYDGTISLTGNNGMQPSVGYVFQTPRLLPWKTIADNIDFALSAWGVERDRRPSIVKSALKQVGLADFAGAYPHELSLGMQARVGVARALATDPDILLMDEPFSHLDEITSRKLRRELQTICQQRQPTVVFITHNPREAAFLADRIYVLSPIPAQVIGEVEVTLVRPRSPEAPDLACAVKQIYELLEKH